MPATRLFLFPQFYYLKAAKSISIVILSWPLTVQLEYMYLFFLVDVTEPTTRSLSLYSRCLNSWKEKREKSRAPSNVHRFGKGTNINIIHNNNNNDRWRWWYDDDDDDEDDDNDDDDNNI